MAPSLSSRSNAPARWLAAWLAAGVLLVAPPAPALTSDAEQPIEIVADRAEADDLERVAIYRGGVVIVQGSLRIEGDTVWVHYDENGDLTKLVSTGRQAHFRQLPDDSEDYRIAYADRLEYYESNAVIVMLGNARYGQGTDQINAQRIVYDSRLARMKADAGVVPAAGAAAPAASTGPPERVRIRIIPKKSKKAAPKTGKPSS